MMLNKGLKIHVKKQECKQDKNNNKYEERNNN